MKPPQTHGKVAVVLFNLGGPDRPEAVEPFLFNLFHDPAIIGVPQPLRWLLAKLIARRRAPTAQAIYARLGGGSPLLPLTSAQAKALEARLQASELQARVFIAMRYWHPLTEETARAVTAFAPDRVVLLPLYPQFSTTTTGSSLTAWRTAAAAAGLSAPTTGVCCYFAAQGWIAAQVELLSRALDQVPRDATVRVLFSAHGLPKRVVAAGDPYQWQVEQTAAAVVTALDRPGLDWAICYQSRVGPLQWIGPSTEAELERAAADGVAVVIVPIAFVSEHSETLVELDVEYRQRAEALGIGTYVRVPAVGTTASFIDALAGIVEALLNRPDGVAPAEGKRSCPASWRRCGCSLNALSSCGAES